MCVFVPVGMELTIQAIFPTVTVSIVVDKTRLLASPPLLTFTSLRV
jgi:hypothetical protein